MNINQSVDRPAKDPHLLSVHLARGETIRQACSVVHVSGVEKDEVNVLFL